MSVTGGTITDDQIRSLHAEAWATYVTACQALGYTPTSSEGSFKVTKEEQRLARYRCAEILRDKETK